MRALKQQYKASAVDKSYFAYNAWVAGSNPATSTICKLRTRECSSVGRAGNSLLSLVALLLNY